jgi:hypothetical protein
MKINLFVLDGSPEPLSSDVAVEPTSAVHADSDTVLFERTDEIRCRKLYPLKSPVWK